MNIIENMSNYLDSLSNKQKAIAKYLMRNKDKIAFMSLKELSGELNISEVTILNFCKSIDVESFTELKKEFQELIKEELKVPAKMKSSLEELDSLEEAIKNTIHIQKQNYEKMISDNIEILQKACKYIENAKTVYICGLGVSNQICEYLRPRLKILNIDARTLEIDNIVMLGNDLARATKDDLFILISFPTYSPPVVNLARYLAMHHLNFIALTDSERSPVAQGANLVLKSENRSLVFYNFISATISLVELLLVILSFNIKDKILSDAEKMEKVQDFFAEAQSKKSQKKKRNK